MFHPTSQMFFLPFHVAQRLLKYDLCPFVQATCWRPVCPWPRRGSRWPARAQRVSSPWPRFRRPGCVRGRTEHTTRHPDQLASAFWRSRRALPVSRLHRAPVCPGTLRPRAEPTGVGREEAWRSGCALDPQWLCLPVSRLEERESEMKKEYNALHQRHTEVGAPPRPGSCAGLLALAGPSGVYFRFLLPQPESG